MRDPCLGAHPLQLRVEVGLDGVRGPLVVSDLSLVGGVAPAADEDLTGGQLPPVAVAEMRVGGAVANPGSVGCARKHLSAAWLDLDLREQLRRIRVGGKDHATGVAFG